MNLAPTGVSEARAATRETRALWLILLLLAVGPRCLALVWWLFAPGRWDAAFHSVVVPAFGIICLPWTTLMFMMVAPSGNVVGEDWWWLAVGLAADVVPLVSSAVRRTGLDYER